MKRSSVTHPVGALDDLPETSSTLGDRMRTGSGARMVALVTVGALLLLGLGLRAFSATRAVR